MNQQLQEDIAESEAEPYLEKASGRKNRRDKTAKAKQKASYRKSKQDREYEDGFGGNV